MNRNRIRILWGTALVLTVAAAVIAPRPLPAVEKDAAARAPDIPAANARPALQTGSSIAEVAARLSPGKWGELLSRNIVPALGMTGASSGTIVAYADNLVWDPGSQRALFIGSDHGALSRFVAYDSRSNTWVQLPQPPWAPKPTDYLNGSMHGYGYGAMDQAQGIYYSRDRTGTKVHRYVVATGQWSELPPPPGTSICCDDLEHFPGLGLVWVKRTGEVLLYRDSTQAWSVLAKGLDVSGTWVFARYNPVHRVLVFGTAPERALYKLDANGIITRQRDLHVDSYDESGRNGVFTVDPVSGQYLLLSASARALFSYDVLTDTWAAETRTNLPDLRNWGLSATPIAESGVILLTGCLKADVCRTMVYRHDASAPRDLQVPAVALVAPATADALSGTVSINVNATDNTAITGVQFYLDGNPLGSEITQAPYAVKWNTHWSTNGAHIITARARDLAGNSATTPAMNLQVVNDPAPATLALADFAARCRAPGVIRCYGFDDAADMSTGHPRNLNRAGESKSARVEQGGPGARVCAAGQCWTLDRAIKAGGAGAVRFELPPNTGSDIPGRFRLNFSDDLGRQIGEGEEFYVQFRQRFSAGMLRAFRSGAGSPVGWHQITVGLGDGGSAQGVAAEAGPCTREAMVLRQDARIQGPAFHHGCDQWVVLDWQPAGARKMRLQHVGEPFCYQPDDPTGGCFRYAADEWMTFKLHVRIACFGTCAGNRVRVWGAREGRPSVLLFDSVNKFPLGFPLSHGRHAGNYGKLWLGPYLRNKDPADIYPIAYTWYDDLVISREDIADPL